MPVSASDSLENIKIRFEGASSQIEASTLINSLITFTDIVYEVNKELDTNSKIEIIINALPKGSFIIDISVLSIIEGAHSIFSKENIAVAKEVIDTVTGIYNFAKYLKGKLPKKVESGSKGTTVYNENGNVTIINNPVYNIYTNNDEVKESLSNEFDVLSKDSNIKGFEILDKKNNKLVEIPQEDFEILAHFEKPTAVETDRNIKKTVTLNISTLSFERNKKWTFYYEGQKITAKISTDFSTRIDSGEKFAKGDSLHAEIEIFQVFDKSVNTYINKAYKILKILAHHPRSEQSKMDF
jgi:hypothetical protein